MAPIHRFFRRMSVGAIALILLGTTGGTLSSVVAAPAAADSAPLTGLANATFTPSILPVTGAEIQNPGRGLYKWEGQEIAPQPGPAMDVYDRGAISWRNLEPTQGNYNLDILDQKAADAKARGGKYSFRIATAWNGVLVPDYLKAGMPKGWWSGSMYIPDWNSDLYLSRAEALWKAIGARFGKDPRFDHLDIGMYGLYGEWHIWGLSDPSSTGATRITSSNARRLIDAQVNAMPDKHWVMLWGNDYVQDAVRYAMAKQIVGGPIGIRNDCLGASQMDAMTGAAAWPQMADRWKSGPVITEVCNIDPSGYSWTAGSWATALQQVKNFHVSMIGNGNTTAGFSSFSSSERNNWLLSGKTAGYRYELRSVTLPTTIAPGGTFPLNSTWANVGVAPTYDNWDVNYTLKSGTGTVAWTGKSTTVLRTILPGTAASTDNFTLPASLGNGTYTLCARVTDPTGYYKPLALAIAGRQSDGSYPLGNVDVRGGTSSTTPPSTTTPAQNVRIKAGGSSYTDSGGNAWQADTSYASGGGAYSVTHNITGTTEPGIYQSERWGMRGYAVPVPNGSYNVKLHFAEINPASGQRIFNVVVENQPWLTNFDIASKVGNYAADVETKTVTVADGTLNLNFSATANSAKISALELVPIPTSPA